MTNKDKKFKNMAVLPSESWQLKFKVNYKETQPVYKTLEQALSARNRYYIEENYRPNHLFIPFMDGSCVREIQQVERSGNIYNRYSIQSRRLSPNSSPKCDTSPFKQPCTFLGI